LASSLIKVGWDRDDRLLDLLAEMGLGGLLHLLQDDSENLRGRILLAVRLDQGVTVGGTHDLIGDQPLVLLDHHVVVASADHPLEGEEGPFRIGDRLTLGRLANELFAVVGEGDNRRCGAHAFRVLDDLGGRTVHDRDPRIGGSQVNPNDPAHERSAEMFRTFDELGRLEASFAFGNQHGRLGTKPASPMFAGPGTATFVLATIKELHAALDRVYKLGNEPARGAARPLQGQDRKSSSHHRSGTLGDPTRPPRS
jgi:hypothetical protein